jgi:4-aminobutyrate aminotransferase-like enzyme
MAGIRYDIEWGNPMNVVELDTSRDAPKQKFDLLIYEPVSGWDGTWNNPIRMRALADEQDALLVADEMITGFGRCGFRFMSYDPDMIVSGKGLAQGAALSVLGIRKGLDENISIGWNTTCGGNNLSASIGLATLQYLMRNETELKNKVLRIENFLRQRRFGRAYGALAFRDLANAKQTRVAFEQKRVIASWHGNVMRIGPNFLMSDDELNQFADAMIHAGEW